MRITKRHSSHCRCRWTLLWTLSDSVRGHLPTLVSYTGIYFSCVDMRRFWISCRFDHCHSPGLYGRALETLPLLPMLTCFASPSLRASLLGIFGHLCHHNKGSVETCIWLWESLTTVCPSKLHLHVCYSIVHYYANLWNKKSKYVSDKKMCYSIILFILIKVHKKWTSLNVCACHWICHDSKLKWSKVMQYTPKMTQGVNIFALHV